MRKVVIIGSAHPLRGGLAAYNERLAREFRHHAESVTIFSFRLQYPSILFPGKTQYSPEPAPEDLDIRTVINSVNPFNWIRMGWRIRNLRPDLVIVKYWMPFMAPCLGTICRIIRTNKHSRAISILDNLIPHEQHPGDRLLTGYFARSVHGFIAMSRSVLQDLALFDRKKPRAFCPHPLYDHYGPLIPKQVARQVLGLDKQSNWVLFFGFIRDYKGLDLLIHAFAEPKIREMNLKLLVAGEFYCDSKPYLDLIRRYCLQDSVVLSNEFIPDNRVVNYFSAADVVVQPYKTATQSGVTQIAYHFEKPMIITNVGGLAEFVADGCAGFVVDPDPAAIAEAITRFYREEREHVFIAGVAREKEKYSWKNMIEAIETLLMNMENPFPEEK